MQDCLTIEELHRLADQADSGPASARAHLADCAACRGQLEGIRDGEALLQDLREAVSQDDMGPTFAAAIEDRFEILAEIRQGGQGTVFKARCRKNAEIVALKVLINGRAASLRDCYRLEREVDLVARLSHPNIVSIRERSAAAGHLFAVMDWVEGEHLDAYLVSQQPDRRQRLRLFLQICEAVAHAHQRGVLHRDLKPSNILVDAAGQARILDFGLAKGFFGRGPTITATGEFAGTLCYASPEHIRQGLDAVDTRGDVYSLGIILYETLLSRPAFANQDSVQATIQQITETEPRYPSELEKDLRLIIAQAIHKDRERRYASAAELARDLHCYLEDRPIRARGESSAYALKKWFRRKRRSLSVSAMLLLLLGSLATILFIEEDVARERQTVGQMSTLLNETLAAVRPERMGADAMELDVLEDAAMRIEQSLMHAPEVAATLRYNIGQTYARLRMPESAMPHLQAALQMFRASKGDEGLEVADCLDKLGAVHSAQNRNEAVAMHQEALRIRRQAPNPNSVAIAETERLLAVALLAGRHPDAREQAEALLQSSRLVFRQELGEESLELTRLRLNSLRLHRDSLSEAERQDELDSILLIARQHGDEDPELILECLREYTWLLQSSDRHEEAWRYLDESIALTSRLYGRRLASHLLAQRAEFEMRRGALSAADQLFRQSLVLRIEKGLREGFEPKEDLRQAISELEGGKDDAYCQAIEVLIAIEGTGTYELSSLASILADLLCSRKQNEVAMRLLESSLVIQCRVFGRLCPNRARNLGYLGRLLQAEGDLKSAEARLWEAREIAVTSENTSNPTALQSLVALSSLLATRGETMQAKNLLLAADQEMSRVEKVYEDELQLDLLRLLHQLCLAGEATEGAAEYEARIRMLEERQ